MSRPSDPRVVDVTPVSVRLDKPGTGPAGGRPGGDGPRATVFTGEVGDFRQGDPATRAVLARFLVARTVGDGAVRALLLVALAFAALTVVLVALSVPAFFSVLAALVTLAWFAAWRVARALWRGLTGGRSLEPVRADLDRVVAETRPDVRRELRRIGLPAHPLAALVLARRLVGARRAQTREAMRRFDVDRVVPPARLDEAFLLLDRTRVR